MPRPAERFPSPILGHDGSVRSLSADALLHLPVRLNGIKVGSPVDVILAPELDRALGLDVLCGDSTHRFLPIGAARIAGDEITLSSALTLVEDPSYYLRHGSAYRALLGHAVARHGQQLGVLRDLVLNADGSVKELVVESPDGATRRYRTDELDRAVTATP
jgi:uncharacterized protein YrrD